jgi:hypothetical protein
MVKYIRQSCRQENRSFSQVFVYCEKYLKPRRSMETNTLSLLPSNARPLSTSIVLPTVERPIANKESSQLALIPRKTHSPTWTRSSCSLAITPTALWILHLLQLRLISKTVLISPRSVSKFNFFSITLVRTNILQKTHCLGKPADLPCVLVHDDLGSLNILSNNNGNVTGILDWNG